MNPVKLIVTSKKNLQFKYESNFKKVDALLKELVKADKARGLDTRIVYVDDPASCRSFGIKPISSTTHKKCKEIVDRLFRKHNPAYIVLLGAQDVFPFQELNNPADDEDSFIPSDLPYACDVAYSRNVSDFTGPTRVVGRIPDIPEQNDPSHFERIIRNSTTHKPVKPELYHSYFSVSAEVWKKSTELSLNSIFGHNGNLLLSPPKKGNYSKKQLQALTHFYNCHGARQDSKYYGQKGNDFPVALSSPKLNKLITKGTIVAAECCYGAELSAPFNLGNVNSIANTYFDNNAISFVGSSTIAYGPADSQGLADLITQYFIKGVLRGASAGRAFLEARQEFISSSGPDLDPYELKTVAQFYLLGDPSVQPAICEDMKTGAQLGNTIKNNRAKLFRKGLALMDTISGSVRLDQAGAKNFASGKKKLDDSGTDIKKILKETHFTSRDKQVVYEVRPKPAAMGMTKLVSANTRFRTFIQPNPDASENKGKLPVFQYRVLVVKEDEEQLLGWRVYVSR